MLLFVSSCFVICSFLEIEIESSFSLILFNDFETTTLDSISTNGMPAFTMSPRLIFNLVTFPSTEAGISIAALSVSSIIIESSIPTFWPTSTHISITSTSSTSPRSGIKGLAKTISFSLISISSFSAGI